MTAKLELLRLVKEQDPARAKRSGDFENWKAMPHGLFTRSLIHALGLQHNPSLAWTHIVVMELEHKPEFSPDWHLSIHVARCGVFKIEEVAAKLDALAGEPAGWSEELLTAFAEGVGIRPSATAIPGRVPLMSFTYGAGLESNLSCGMSPPFNAASLSDL